MKSRENKLSRKYKVDPVTGKPSDQPNAISYGAFKARKKVDPVTGKPSDQPDAISYGAFKARKKVDPVTGKPSDQPNAISYRTFLGRKKVDPVTGKPSDQPNAIPYSVFLEEKKVDPVTGKPSDQPDAISYSAFKARKKVDPVTGEPSDQPNAIPYSAFLGRKKVDPVMGKPSDQPDAISYGAFKARKKVDPVTGKPSDQLNAISYSAFRRKKKLDPVTGKPSDQLNAISYSAFRRKKKLDPVTGKPSDQPNAISRNAFNKRKSRSKKPLDNQDMIASDAVVSSTISVNSLETITIKTEPEVDWNIRVKQPVLTLDRDKFKAVAAILRGESKRMDDCTYLVHAFINYLSTGEMPSQPAPSKAPDLDFLTLEYFTEEASSRVKSEPSIEAITYSMLPRNTVLGGDAPPAEMPQEINGRVDLTAPPIYDVDYSIQKSAVFTELKAALQAEAKASGGVSFGMVSLAPVGEYVDALWHCIVYYATPNEVVYIDCQQKDRPVFESIEENYIFLTDEKPVHDSTFGNMVFYTPYSRVLVVNQSSMESVSTPIATAQKRKRVEEDSDSPVAKRARFFNPNSQGLDQVMRNAPANEEVLDAMDIDGENEVASHLRSENIFLTQFGVFANSPYTWTSQSDVIEDPMPHSSENWQSEGRSHE